MDVGKLIERSIERSRVLCLDPFDLRRWLTIAVASWLAWLGNAGTNFNFNLPLPDMGDPSRDLPFGDGATVSFAIFAAAVGLTFALLFWLLLTWLRSRGQVMLIDIVATASGELGELWSRSSSLASDLFRIRIIADLVFFAVSAITVGAGFGLAISTDPSDPLSALSSLPVLGGLSVFALFAVVWALLTWMLDEIVLPIAWARRMAILEAASAARLLVAEQPLDLFLYALIRLVSGGIVALLAVMLSCMMCAIAWIPFVMAVIVVPLRVFLQALPLAFLYGADPERYTALAPMFERRSVE